ncbi:zf-DHHC-domain-containing protein [Panus rudis PR-1116 ss-1]|nr:zf-DHHC-domain-containing protein [Panus rudis PR-1116 ss-1]
MPSDGTKVVGGNGCCRVVEEAASRAQERSEKRRNKPQPWIVLKLTIFITLAIIAYTFYVYIGRFCVPMLKHNTGALGGREIGIPLLVVFCVFGLIMLWAYAMVCFTSSGKAKDYVKPSPEPVFNNGVPPWFKPFGGDIGSEPYQYVGAQQVQNEGTHDTRRMNGHHINAPVEKPSEQQDDPNIGVTDTLPPVQKALARAEQNYTGNGVQPSQPNGNGNHIQPLPDTSSQPMMYSRKPPTTPVLLPEYRYCYKDGFVKPLRAHHCRACGTCILKYDHHCPWVGQCVGARNHKYFVNFLEWAFIFCAWTLSTLIAQNVESARGIDGDIDPQQVVIIALAGLFLVFTGALLATHVRLIVQNYTTVESIHAQRMEEQENVKLARLHKFYEWRAKRETRRRWDQEWGRIRQEGHIWWLGSYRKNWEYVMGRHVWEWFLPIGRGGDDGLSYPVNPRFDAQGRWRPRREWPKELQ